jgi:hypothetical protein
MGTGDPNTVIVQGGFNGCPALKDGYSRYQNKSVPVNQGIFVWSGKEIRIVQTLEANQDNDFVYWVYSGKPPTTGGSHHRNLEDSSSAEPPRWRSGAFTALSSYKDVMFKMTKDGVTGIWHWDGNPDNNEEILAVGKKCLDGDPGMIVDSISIERDSYRWSQLAIAAACSVNSSSVTVEAAGTDEDSDDSDWGGIYVRKLIVGDPKA